MSRKTADKRVFMKNGKKELDRTASEWYNTPRDGAYAPAILWAFSSVG